MAAKAKQIDLLLSGLCNDEGVPISGGKVYTYEAGTSNLSTLYLDRDKTSSATNPIILDTHGRAEVFGDGLYKFVVKDSNDVDVFDVDNLEYLAIYGGSGVFEDLTVNDTVTLDGFLDEDNMASNSATKGATQQSIKAYSDASSTTAANNLAAVKDIYNFYIKYPYVDAAGTIQEQLIARTGTLDSIKAILGTDATGAAFILDVLNNGTVIKRTGDTYTFADITNTITVKTDHDATTLTANQYIGIRIHQVGSSVVGQDLRIQLVVSRS